MKELIVLIAKSLVDKPDEVDLQEADNAVNNTKKEVGTRYDFRQSNTQIEFNRTEKTLSVLTSDDMKMQAVQDTLISNFVNARSTPNASTLAPTKALPTARSSAVPHCRRASSARWHRKSSS